MIKQKIYIILFLFTFASLSSQIKVDENELKSVIIEKFTKFIDWHESSPINNVSQPVRLSLIGNNEFTTKLERIYHNYLIKNKPVITKFINKIDDFKDSDILIITKNSVFTPLQISNILRGKPVLIITDQKEYQDISHIFIYILNDKLKFSINDKLARENGLKISYLLLKHAEEVR